MHHLHHISRLLAPLLLLAAIVCGCANRRVAHTLDVAEAVMELHPDSALALLQSVDRSRLSGRTQARHALLLSQAYDKNTIDIASDSIIGPAYTYFRRSVDTDDDRYRMLAFYYKGVTSYNARDYHSSIYFTTIADTLAARLNDNAMRARTNSQLLLCYGWISDLKKSRKFTDELIRFSRLAGDSAAVAIGLQNLAISHLEFEHYDSALMVLQNPLCSDNHLTRAVCYLKSKRIDKYNEITGNYPKLKDNRTLKLDLAECLIEIGRLSEADSILSAMAADLETTDSVHWLKAKSQLSLIKNDYKSYAQHLRQLYEMSRRENDEVRQTYIPLNGVMATEYLSEFDSKLEKRTKTTLIVSLAGMVLLLVILLLAVFLLRKHMMMQKLSHELESMRAKAHNTKLRNQNTLLKQDKTVLIAEKEHHSKTIERLTEERDIWEQRSNELVNELNALRPSGSISAMRKDLAEAVCKITALYDEFVAMPSGNPDSESRKKQIQHDLRIFCEGSLPGIIDPFLNAEYDNFITRCRGAKISTDDLKLLRLLSLGLPGSMIEIVMNVKSSSLRSRKSRLTSKLSSLGLLPIPSTN